MRSITSIDTGQRRKALIWRVCDYCNTQPASQLELDIYESHQDLTRQRW
jgi:hypothetical protein